MVRAVLLVVAAVILRFVVAMIIGWLTHRDRASWVHIACATNTVILTCVVLAIDRFRLHGLTVWSVFFALVMLWLASGAAESGVTGFNVLKELRRGKEDIRTSSLEANRRN